MSLATRSTAATLVLLLAPLAACGSDPAPAQPAAPAASQAATTSAPSASETPSPASEERTAEEVFEDISAKVDSASLTTVYDEESDPNDLLGRPNGYTSKVAFADSRVKFDDYEEQGLAKDDLDRGGSIEVFPDAEGAKMRAEYIQGVKKSNGILGSEYTYVDGTVLVRVTGKLTPKQAKDYEEALG